MSLQLFDLPHELLLHILSYITNIREKIRLASVNSMFYNLVTDACRIQNYKLVNYSDYMYESEYKNLANEDRIINLHELLRIAPRLTHLVDKIHHFGYETPGSDVCDPLPLIHTKYLYVDLCGSYFFGKQYENVNLSLQQKITIALTNIPEVIILDIRADKEYEMEFPLLQKLKVFKFSLFEIHGSNQSVAFPYRLVEMVSVCAPNLEEIYFNASYVDVYYNLPGLFNSLATNCPNLRSIKIFCETSPYNGSQNFKPLTEDSKLLALEYLDIRGFSVPINFWDRLLSMMPNLKFLAFDPSTDPRIKSVISTNCRNVKYDLNRPFEIEEEFRVYNRRTYGFNTDRYL